MKTIPMILLFQFGLIFGVVGARSTIAEQQIRIITGCVIESESGNVNNRSEMAYYNCGTQAAFMMVTGSTGDLRLREMIGKTVDFHLEVVK